MGGRAQAAPTDLRATLEQLDVRAEDALFVGDTWGPDVEGPRALGITPVYLERDGHWPDTTAPPPHAIDASQVARARDLMGLLELL